MANEPRRWTFLTNHGHVLLAVAEDGDQRVSQLADRVGITERATLRILRDLEEEGYLSVTREGRRNLYEVNPQLPMRHPRYSGHKIGELLRALAST